MPGAVIQQVSPEIRVLAFPRSAIATRDSEGLIIADRIASLLYPGAGDYRSQLAELTTANNPTISADWAQAPHFDVLQNIGLARFAKDGTVSFGPSVPQNAGELDVAGVFIQPREAPLDCKIGDSGAATDAGFTDLNWDAEAGVWKTLPSKGPQGSTGIYNIGGEVLAKARTRGNLPANRSMRFDLDFWGLNKSGPTPRFRLMWGNRLSFVLEHGAAPTIERLEVVPDGAGGSKTEWTIWKTLHGSEPLNLIGAHYRIYVERLAGRLVFRIGGVSIWLLDDKSSAPSGFGDVAWSAAPLRVHAHNCRVRLEMAVVKWSTAAGALLQALIGRLVPHHTALDESALVGSYSGGWKGGGTGLVVSPSLEAGAGVRYAARLTASADGIDTPFLQTVLVEYRSTWQQSGAGAINLARAVLRCGVSLALPPVLAGSEVTLDLDFEKLKEIAGWQGVTKARCPLEVSIRWSYSDGSRGPWSNVFSGYVFSPGQDVSGYKSGAVRLTGRDPIIRLQKPAGLIDYRFGPMELRFLEKLQNLTGGYDPDTGRKVNGNLFGAECFQAILRGIMGDAVADSLNGNGDPLRFMPSFQPPLLSMNSDSAGYVNVAGAIGLSSQSSPSLLSGGFIFPPPFFEDALTWGSRFAADEFALICWGHADGDTSQPPTPIYGNYLNIIANRKLVILRDAPHNGDTSRLLSRLAVETHPEKIFNRFLVAGNLGGANALEGLAPAMRLAEARFAPGDLDSAGESWEMTDVIENPVAAMGNVPGRGAAEGIALARRDLVRGVRLEWPVLTFRGDETLQPGDVALPLLSPVNAAFGLYNASVSGRRFRIERIEHDLDMTSGTFNTTAYTRPLSNQETGASRAAAPLVDGEVEDVVEGVIEDVLSGA